jgi:hypothetical protein
MSISKRCLLVGITITQPKSEHVRCCVAEFWSLIEGSQRASVSSTGMIPLFSQGSDETLGP